MLISKLPLLLLISVGEQNGPCDQGAGSGFGIAEDQITEKKECTTGSSCTVMQ